MKLLKKMLIILLCIAALLITVFLTGRYSWKLGGFNACETAGIEQVDNTLYVGFKFSALFGIFETGDFDITIPTKGIVTQVVVKSGEHEYRVWPQEDEFFVSETEATENGIYVHLERSDVYSVGWYFENKSGGMTNADGTALEVGKNIYLDNDVFYTASNLERLVPMMLTFSDKDGKTIAHVNLSYNSESPVLTATLTADARIYVNSVNDDGEPVQIFSSIERDRYYYAGGVRFANVGSSGADNSYVTTVKLEGDGLVDMTFTTDPKDYVQMQFVAIAESMENSKTTSENAVEIIYEGEYASYDTDEPMLYIQKNEDGTYSIQIGIYRLIQLDKCVGIDKGDRLEFSTVELGENQEITGMIILNGEVATVTLYALWSDTWFKDVNEFVYYKLGAGK